MYEKRFIDACLAGDAILDDIEDYIDFWHDNETGVELYEFLGMTSGEYAKWINAGEDTILCDIVESKNGNEVNMVGFDTSDKSAQTLTPLFCE